MTHEICRRPTRNAVIGHEYNIICSITWAIYGHYMFYLKHEWSLMTHEWPWTKISCSTFGLSFWLNPQKDGCCVCLLSAGEQAPRQKTCSPTINPFGISPWQKEKQWKPVGRGKAILHDCMVFIVFFNFSTLSTKLTKNRSLLIIATVVIGENIGERS